MENEHRYFTYSSMLEQTILSTDQVHKLEDGTISVFSRNSEDMSKKYPDLMDQLPTVRYMIEYYLHCANLYDRSVCKTLQNLLFSMRKPLLLIERQESFCHSRSSVDASAKMSR